MAHKRWRLLAILVLAFALVAAACGDDDDSATTTTASSDGGDATTAAPSDGEAMKVALVLVGPVSDKGWSWAHEQGTQYLEQNMNVEVTVLEDIAEGSDSQRVFEELAADGNKLIFGTSFGYMDPMLAAAESYPDTVFMHSTGYKVADNMGNYFGAAEESRYLSGMAAGAATETDLIGYVAAFPIAEVVRGINAFALGAQEVNPDAQVQVVWTSTWFDPVLEGDAARSLLDAGADVIAMHQDSTAPGQAADAAGGKWVGYNTDRSDLVPDAWLTAPIWDWGPYYLATAQAVADGTWVPEAHYGNMADGMVGLASFGTSVAEETQTLIKEREAEIKAGTFEVFPDPIIDQDGNEIPLGDIFAMDYFVLGVIGSIPTS